MTDTKHEAPERIWVDYWLTGKKPRQVTEEDLGGCTEYVRADLVQAAVAAKLREAAQAARLSISEREEWPPKDGDVLVDDCMAAILALIPKGEE